MSQHLLPQPSDLQKAVYGLAHLKKGSSVLMLDKRLPDVLR